MRIDLHTHSACSDGTQSPAELMRAARDAGLDVVGLVDHDTVSGWSEAAQAAHDVGITLVRGMEVTARYSEQSVHILGYLFNPEDERIQAHMAALQSSRVDRARLITERLSADYPITYDDVRAQASDANSIGRPHIADALVAAGVVANRSEAFESILHPSSPYYVPQRAICATDAVRMINEAGGKAVWAHPYAVKRGSIPPLEAFDELKAAGLFGVEVDHRDNPEQTRPALTAIVEERGFARFGSSDYHGTGKPNILGENLTSPEVFHALTQGTFLEVC